MSARKLFAAVLLILAPVVLAAAPPSGSGEVFPFKMTEKTLPNGLKVIVVPTGFPNIVSVQIPVQTGSRNEVEPGKSGFAHFFEHMMFRGTKAYPAERYNEIVTRTGAQQNAYTTDDYTNFHTTFSRDDLETILKIEADRFQNLDYSLQDFKTESRAVLGEYNKNSANPIRKLMEVERDHAFTRHTYKHTTMGFLRDIEDMPNQFDYSKTFFDRWYRPEYVTVIVAGDVDPEKVIPLVEKYWGGWKRGSFKAEIPQEPPSTAPVYTHIDWPSPTLPYVAVGFHGPAFSDHDKDWAAVSTLFDLAFGPTSDLYKKLVEKEQKVDQFFGYVPMNADPSLVSVFARVKDPADAVHVRDEILATFAKIRSIKLPAAAVAAAEDNARFSFVRNLDNTDSIAAELASYVRVARSGATINNYFRTMSALTPDDLLAIARKYFVDDSLVVTTLSKDPLPESMSKLPLLADLVPAAAPATEITIVTQKSPLPLVDVKLLFTAGSADDPPGKEGLATLAASMISDSGSKEMTINEIRKALYPMAGDFVSQVDKEMTTFTASVHRDKLDEFLGIVLPMLLDPGFREEDFKRIRDTQLNALTQNLRSNNEEELGKEELQSVVFAGTPYAHTPLGTEAGLKSITLDDVKNFVREAYTRGNLMVGIAGDYPDDLAGRLSTALARLPEAPGLARRGTINGHTPNGPEVTIVKKDTRATAISLGFPIDVRRGDPDFAALWLARSWLGEHRSSMSHLYQRIREIRGMNYGDYAYIEAFPRGMFQFFPDPNLGRRAQLFEIWIRPVAPENGHMALRIALHELGKMIDDGLTQDEFETTRDYLMKNVFVMTATQDQQLGYALDSKWYGIPEFTSYMRGALSKLTLDDVNRAIRKHLSAKNVSIVIITKDAEGLKQKLVSDEISPIHYDAEKPQSLLDEDKVIGAMKLGITPEKVTIVPVDEVFAR
ncbi:MAG: pitrilysin family protein [Thermoanaerobaculia bacterium]